MPVKFGASILSWVPPLWTAEAGLYAIEKTAAAGFDLLEILLPASMDIDTQTVKKQLRQHGLDAVSSFNLPRDCHIPFYPEKALAAIKLAIDKTAALDLNFLGGVLHGGIGVFSGSPRTASEEDIICGVWHEAAIHAQKSGITIGIEPINRYESYVCTNAADVLQLIHRVNMPNLSLHLDTFHMNIEENGFYEPVIAAGNLLKHVHVTESDRGMLGEGNVRWDDFFAALAAIQYSGGLVIENFSSSVPGMAEAVSLWRPSKYDAAALAAGSLQFMRQKADVVGL